MNLDRAVMAFAGVMILISVALAHFVSPWWLLLTAFVGLNLLQSSFTGFCPAAMILRKLGVGRGAGRLRLPLSRDPERDAMDCDARDPRRRLLLALGGLRQRARDARRRRRCRSWRRSTVAAGGVGAGRAWDGVVEAVQQADLSAQTAVG